MMTRTSLHPCGSAAERRHSLKLVPWVFSTLMVLWLGGVASGFYVLFNYSTTPGASRPAHLTWPQESRLVRSTTEPTLLMFLHPHCPCSRASIEELNRSLAQINQHVRAFVVFVRPFERQSSWVETDLWRTAQSLPAAQVIEDVDGVEARRFGAKTSGATFVFDLSGALRFSGGVTAGRGHMGGNPAQAAVVRALTVSDAAATARFPVYGCSLASSDESRDCKDVPCHK